MIKCEVIENFTLKDFKKLKNIVRKGQDLEGHLYKEDTFECDEDMAKYLTGNNGLKKEVVKVIEVKPKEEKPIKSDEKDTKVIVKASNKETKKAIKRKKGE